MINFKLNPMIDCDRVNDMHAGQKKVFDKMRALII